MKQVNLEAGQITFFLTSVPHSGTRFFNRLLQIGTIVHFTSGSLDKFMQEADVVACAIRRPEDVWQSWHHRGKSQESQREYWHRSWARLAEWSAKRFLYFLPIDHPSRDRRLRALTDVLDIPVLANWNHTIGRHDVDRGKAPPIDLSFPYSIPIIQELYGESQSRARLPSDLSSSQRNPILREANAP